MYTLFQHAKSSGTLLHVPRTPKTTLSSVIVRYVQRKHTPEIEPWLFMPVSPNLKDFLAKKAEEEAKEPKGSLFTGVKLTYHDVAEVKRERLLRELDEFRTAYEKPLADAYKEVYF